MTHQIDYGTIGWEQFEDLCLSLWFDEGYTNIKPMGRRKEGGRDAIFVDAETGELTIFQFKRWVSNYNTSTLKSMIGQATEKIAGYKPKRFIINSAQDPNAAVNDSIPNLSEEMGFEVEYWDRSWLDLRLNNRRQDIRRDYFGLNLAHHTWNSLVAICRAQVARTVTSLAGKYDEEIYVRRDAESRFFEFMESDKAGLAIVDQSGRGKTNLFCKLAQDLRERGKIAILIRGDTRLTDDHGLERLVVEALGYDTSEFQVHLRNASRLLQERGEICYVLLDGLSETDDLSQANRSLRALLARFSELGCIKVGFTCRDVAWPQIGYDLPKDMLFVTGSAIPGSRLEESHELYIGDFSDDELEAALDLYCERYSVDFSLAADARNQLRNPLLLRFFCEAHRDQSLGEISAVPVAETFDVYLDSKTAVLANRLKGRYSKNTIFRLLRDIAGQMWHLQDAKALSEGQWSNFLPENATLSEGEELLQLLAQEGMIFLREEPITRDRSLRIVFDNLREYLLLHYLLSRLPEQIRAEGDICEIAVAALKHFKAEVNNLEAFSLLSLVGMLLPEVSKRQGFLESLLAWDFQTFCACLARIPPTGPLNRCTEESLRQLGEHLRVWLPRILGNVMSDDIRTSLNYWDWTSLQDLSVEIEVVASPECREVSYWYRARKGDQSDEEPVKVDQVTGYPTFKLSIGTESERIELHDPEKGMIIPSWHGFGAIQRTRNASFPPAYAGESFNVPERMALYDAWEEIPQLLTDKFNRFRQLPTLLLQEKETPDSPNDSELSNLSDEELSEYLKGLFVRAMTSYRMLVGRYFTGLENVLNLAAQLPCSFYFTTDRANVKYGFIPVHSGDEMRFFHRVLDPSHDIADPKWKITMHDDESEYPDPVLLEDFVRDKLKRMNKLRPPIQPVDRVEPIDNFFTHTPVNDLTDKWLLSDFQLVFGF